MSIGLESLGLIPIGLPSTSQASNATTVSCTTGAMAIGGLTATVGTSTTISCSVASLSVAGLSANVQFGTITITSPVTFQTFQRDGSNQANIAITGTYTGSPTSIQASFNGGAWANIVASPAGGTFSGTLSAQSMGQGTLSVRFGNDTSVVATKLKVKIGDIYIVMGQSNHVGQAPNYVNPSTANGNASIWGVDGTWRELLETTSDRFSTRANGVQCSAMNQLVVDGQGSYFGALATLIMAAGVPVAFVPCAIGSSAISGWQPGGTHNNPATAYGSALTRAQSVGNFKAALWYQGEMDGLLATTYATYVSLLNSLIDSWYADTGKKVVVYLTNRTGSGTLSAAQTIQNAQLYVGRSNANAIPGPNMDLLWSSNVHYQTAGDINAVASKTFDVLSAQYYGGTVVSCSAASIPDIGLSCSISASGGASAAVLPHWNPPLFSKMNGNFQG
jgi:hypothetical protein